ncbi:hypothetical protein ACP70R_022321 [Stipagrostis hirtigluma subsp. patula]
MENIMREWRIMEFKYDEIFAHLDSLSGQIPTPATTDCFGIPIDHEASIGIVD